MEHLIEKLIADFHERTLPALTRRRLRLPMLPNKIDTLIGMRRTGKTCFLFQLAADLLSQGHPREAVLYLNLEDERLLPLQAADLQRIPDTFFRRYPGLHGKPCWFFFDEIQNIPGWERFVRRLLDAGFIRLCVTGSSSRLLSREIATSLRGRSLATEVLPGARKRALLANRFRTYLEEGGFPEVQGLEAEHRIRILQDYLDVVILRDVVERHQVAGTAALRYLIRHLVNAAGALFSVHKFYNDLKSQGIAVSKNTLHDYLQHLTDAFLFFPVPVHTGSERARMVNPRKVYAVDTGLVRACSRSLSPDRGRLLENLVFLELRRRQQTIEYYKTRSGREVDFLVTDSAGRQNLVQVAADLADAGTRSRELAALEEAMAECGLDRAVIVTLDQEETLTTARGRIAVTPAWQWLLFR